MAGILQVVDECLQACKEWGHEGASHPLKSGKCDGSWKITHFT